MHGTYNLILRGSTLLAKVLSRKVLIKVISNQLFQSLTSASHLMIITESPGLIRASQSWSSIKFKLGYFHQV